MTAADIEAISAAVTEATQPNLDSRISLCLGFVAIVIAIAAWWVSRKQAVLMANQNDASVYTFIVEYLQDPEARESREQVYRHFKSEGPKWHPQDDEHPRRVAWTFDVVATISTKSDWCRKHLIRDWGPQIVKCWMATEAYIEQASRHEGVDDLFRNFRELAEKARESVDASKLKWGYESPTESIKL